jgi:hypothetical protein
MNKTKITFSRQQFSRLEMAKRQNSGPLLGFGTLCTLCQKYKKYEEERVSEFHVQESPETQFFG